MFENFKKLIIQGGCFETETELELFRRDPITVIYGRNGSGKTTIAKQIGELVLPEEQRNPNFIVSADVAISPDFSNHLFIFDEDFVTSQVRFRPDGIDTIVMLGEMGTIDEKIEFQEKKKKEVEKTIETLNILRSEFDDAKNPKSPFYHYNKIVSSLRDEQGWADTERIIKGNKIKSKITESVVESFVNMTEPTDSYKVLFARMLNDKELYLQSEKVQEIIWINGSISCPNNLKFVTDLINKIVDKPIISAREERLLNFLSIHPQSQTPKMVDEQWEFCPLCLRDMQDNDRNYITAILKKLLNQEAENYKTELIKVKEQFDPLELTLPVFPSNLYQKEINDLQIAMNVLNKMLQTVRDSIDWKIIHIYEKVQLPFEKEFAHQYEVALQKYNMAMTQLKQRVDAFNKLVKERSKLQEKVLLENKQATRKQLASVIDVYRQSKVESDKNNKDLNDKLKEKEKIEAEIKSLIAKKERTDIALDYINDELSYVFYSNRKLRLVAGENNKYKLQVNGKNVSPNKISVGERNVLALCYFFAKLYSDKEDKSKYKTEYLIVIDDPVSSFDYGNRLGVMTLLRYQFFNICKGNEKSRILVLSHDLYSVFDLVKTKNDVCGKSTDGKKGYLALEDRKLVPATMKNEYGVLINHVFDYAVHDNLDELEETNEIGIGNIMRRLLEGFASFCYNKSFEEMLRMEDLLVNISPEKKRLYYGNFMFRLALNGESHMEESSYSLNNFTRYFPHDEKVKTAKTLLLFLFYVNKPHLVSYLGEKGIEKIKEWITEEEVKWITTEVAKT